MRNWHKQVFFGTKNFLHSANLQATIQTAGFLQVLLKSSFKKLLLGTGLWQHAKMSTSLKSPDGLKDAECEKEQLSHRLPILYISVVDIVTPKEEPQIFKVKLPDALDLSMPYTPMGTTRNTLCTLLQSSASSNRRGCPRSAGCLARLLWNGQRHWRISKKPRVLEKPCQQAWIGYGQQGGDWADSTDALRIPEGSQQGNCQDVQATKKSAVRWCAVPMGSRLPQDAQAWLVGCSKWSSDQR